MMKLNKVFIISIILAIMVIINIPIVYATTTENSNEEKDYIYLSDIDYEEEKSFAADSHYIRLDKNEGSNLITLKVEGAEKRFLKGICAWATSEIVYDLSNYDFDYFTSYLGVDISEQNTYYNTGVKFYIYTSNDGKNWGEPIFKSDYMDASSEAQFIKVDIKNIKYLKLVADDNSDSWWSSWYDEAVYANAKLIKEGYVEDNTTQDFIKTVSEYDEIIKNTPITQEISGEYELTLLQREFVNNVGYDILQEFIRYNSQYKELILWLINDVDNLRMYIMGGTPDGGYIESIKVLVQLYNTYKEDLLNEEVTEHGVVLKDLYKRMIITLSLTHSTDVGLWVNARTGTTDDPNGSNAIERYAIYKKLHSENLLDNKIFESLVVEEMRFVMNNIIDDEEIVWLNNYSREKNSRNPYSYITYTFDYNYSEAQYYDPENYDKWDEKYKLSEYNITYKEGFPKLWVVFEEGSVCGGLSKTGSNLHGVFGVPSSVVGQPGHAAYIFYSQDENGNGVWNLYNDVSGWAQSSRTEKLSIRMPNGWGIGSYASDYPVTYVLLAQANLNDFGNYEKSEKILLLANTYSDNKEKLNEIYRNALESQPLNFDAWYGLVNLYIQDNTKTDKDYCELAEEIATTLKYYPLPMYDLLRMIESYIKSTEYQVQFILLQKNTLSDASNATGTDTLQVTAVKAVANYLLGNIDTEIAKFSFDGENAGAIVLSERFNDVGVAWEYSLDNKETWKQTEEHKLQLSETELESINEEKDIHVHIVGTNYEEKNIYVIDIEKSTIPTNIYNNDYENKVIGVTDKMEWKFVESDKWTLFREELPDLIGNKTVMVRTGSNGKYLYSDSISLDFTSDIDTKVRKYIPISNLSIEKVSSEEVGKNNGVLNTIDGNLYTHWHTSWDGSDTEKYITIKLTEPMYISAIEYVPRNDADNGKVKSAQILVSMDGEEWTEVVSSTEWNTDSTPKNVEFNDSILSQYIKVVGKETVGNYMSASMINLFEDITKKEIPVAEIEYSTKELTNQDVLAKLVNPSKEITITNNDGKDTYLFEENGQIVFEFVDNYGNKGSAIAKVDWIDKTPPSANIEYSTQEETTENVIAKLVSDENIIIINNNGSDTYIFTENTEFEFIYKDEAGNINKTKAIVNWIIEKENTDNNEDSGNEDNGDQGNNNEGNGDEDNGDQGNNNKGNGNEDNGDQGNNNEGNGDQGNNNEGNDNEDNKDGDLDKEIILGDIDKNGKITVTDLSKLKLHYTKIKVLDEIALKAADINKDGKITISDISQLKLIIVGLVK